MNKIIDLRTDTVTQPTPAMLAAMQTATQGDDSRDGDATVMKLEALAAKLTGKDAGLYMPSGTMTNLVAVLAHTSRAGEVLLERGAHILNNELGGLSAVAGVYYKGLPGDRGAMDEAALRDAVRPMTRNNFGTALICMETTHNGAGGTVLSLAHMKMVHALAREHGIPVHTDGARFFNAAVALGVPAATIAQHTDSVCFCVSKGLSAPVGSVLCGTSAFIERARPFRRMVGGAMRQAGSIAAAGIVGLETMVERLAEDHTTARRLATGLHSVDASLVDPDGIETNIVRISVRASKRNAAQWAEEFKARGIAVSAGDPMSLRFVTHRHISNADVDATVATCREI
ncbi:MAG: aminotransferase class I/II-fold pyridoxal phosphate-dependent enzyme, partial [Betaproteobacteria bacterium]|nr:aminotransferase class I/II-fold pyridoxal phosphate-dependent enzyme [Betaproteobacteria bacterium]